MNFKKLKPIPTWGLIALFLAAVALDLKSFLTVDQRRLAAAECQATNNGPFDGPTLYRCTLEAVAETHRSLQDPRSRAAFVDRWRHKFDAGQQLATERGTMKAIAEMLLDLRGRFDYVLPPRQVEEQRRIAGGRIAGIGATLSNQAPAAKSIALPEHMTPQLAAVLADQLPAEAVLGETNPMLVASDPEEGTPAARAGLKQGDQVVLVNGQPVAGLTIGAAIELVRGEVGTKVDLTIRRGGRQLTLSVVREMIELPIVEAKTSGEIGYLRIAHFSSMHAVDQIEAALSALCESQSDHDRCSLQGLIIDLRNNPGGLIDAVILSSELFVESGQIVQIDSRQGDRSIRTNIAFEGQSLVQTSVGERQRIKRDLLVHFPSTTPLIVLINEHSASGAEMLATVLQQQRHAIVIGQQTLGKGVGQCSVDLPFGYAAELICMEYVPGSKAIDYVGVVPDLIVNQSPDAGSDESADSQLQAALSLASGNNATASDATTRIETLDERKAAYEKEVQDTLQRFFR
jgi:C-terminal peptidase prc